MKKIIPVPLVMLHEDEQTLRKKSEPVDLKEIGTEKFNDFCNLLYESMLASEIDKGWMHAGISAIQIGRPVRVFFAYDSDTDNYNIFINPEIKPIGNKTDIKQEACLSILDQKGDVERYKKIKVTYYNEFGVKLRKRFSGWNARVIQHEFDHLNGVLFIDKVL